MKERVGRPFTAFLLSLVMATVGNIAIGPSASARPTQDCFSGFGLDEFVNLESLEGQHVANRANVKTATWDSNDCQRIVGVSIVGGAGGLVEFSWVVGWLGGIGCPDQYFSAPRTFIVTKPVGGAYACRVKQQISEDSWYTLAVRDQNDDTTWSFVRDGNVIDTWDLNFDRGVSIVGRERGNADDEGHAHFKALSWMLANYGWSNWGADHDQYEDNDEDYGTNWISNTEVTVVHV